MIGVVVFAGLGGALGFDGLVAVAGDEGGEGLGLRRVGLEEEAAVLDVEVGGLEAVEGRLRRR